MGEEAAPVGDDERAILDGGGGEQPEPGPRTADAAKLGVSYDSFEAVARTDFDVRGHMMADAPTSAFQKVTISISVVSDAPEDKLKEVERLSFEGCPGVNTLREPVPVETRLTVTRTPSEQAA